MRETIDNFINSKEISNGLFIADMPTGYGKTYIASRSIYDYVYNFNGKRKIFFITTLKKNFPQDELRKAYLEGGNPDDYEKDVLVIKSNFDYVCENLLKVKIPEKFRMKSYYDLQNKLKILYEIESNGDKVSGYIKDGIENEIRDELEKNFRKDILNIIKNNLPKTSSERIEAIRSNKQFKWIAEIYPTVFMKDYKIFFLTIDKFLVKNTVLIEPSYNFINNDITNNSIIFIDEFDSGKETIEKALIDKALTSKHDYIKLFLQIYNSFKGHEFSKDITDICNECRADGVIKYSFDTLSKEAEEIFKEFKLKYSYKTVSNGIDRKQSFLFNDNSYHTMLRNKCNYIRATVDEDIKQVSIYFEDKEKYYQNRKEDDIIIYTLVRNISRFLFRFKIMILNVATNYSKYVNQKRHKNDDEFTIENAMKTMYREFSLSNNQINLLMNDLCASAVINNQIEGIIPDMSFYNSGFKYFEFEDSDEHLNETVFNYVDIYDTPEKIITFLSRKAKVIGISATAGINTVTANYDLNYFERQLKDNFMFIPKDVYKRIDNELNYLWKDYNSGKIKINTAVLNQNKHHLSMEERLEEIFVKNSLVKKYCNKVSINSAENDYVWQRYCNIFMAIKEFIIHDDIKSFLCLNMVLPKVKNDKSNFDLGLFKEALVDLAKLFNKYLNEDNLYVLRSENFDEDKEYILNRLSNNEKIFIMSSYKTIGAGQNLQYKISSLDGLVKIKHTKNEADPRTRFKDIDAIFLGDITNIAVNIYNSESFDKYSLLKFFMQIEYLYENDEISYSTLDRLIKLGFKKYSRSNENDNIYSELTKSKSIRRQATRDVMQAIGRMCRTYIKNSNIYIYTVEELLDKVDVGCLSGKILSPEMRAFVELVDGMGYKYNEEEMEVLNKAERISSRGKNFIMRILSRDWNDVSVNLWKELRKVVLKSPTANEDTYTNNEIVKNLYINGYTNINKYLYAQKGDFSDVVIDFKNDKFVFGNSERCEDRFVSEVSENEARLSEMLSYKGLIEYFNLMGYATNFKKEKYIVSPILFNNIYKGALGEEVGKFILEQELGIKLKEIEDANRFEFFDFEISDGVYIDFKHWKQGYREEKLRDNVKSEIRNKLEKIKGKRVYIINILADAEFVEHKQVDGKLIEIPCLLNSDGTANVRALNILRGEIIGDN